MHVFTLGDLIVMENTKANQVIWEISKISGDQAGRIPTSGEQMINKETHELNYRK